MFVLQSYYLFYDFVQFCFIVFHVFRSFESLTQCSSSLYYKVTITGNCYFFLRVLGILGSHQRKVARSDLQWAVQLLQHKLNSLCMSLLRLIFEYLNNNYNYIIIIIVTENVCEIVVSLKHTCRLQYCIHFHTNAFLQSSFMNSVL